MLLLILELFFEAALKLGVVVVRGFMLELLSAGRPCWVKKVSFKVVNLVNEGTVEGNELKSWFRLFLETSISLFLEALPSP